MSNKGFKPDVIQKILTCRKCGDKIFSRYPGEFRMCKCKSVYIDQTDWYTRSGGNQEDMDWSENERKKESK